MGSFLLFCYFLSLSLFSIIKGSLYLCLALIFKLLICCFTAFFFLGFSWYSLLFCIVYVGGVYVLLLFIVLQTPNNLKVGLSSGMWVFLLGTIMVFVWSGVSMFVPMSDVECSYYLCSKSEGLCYVFLCAMLLLGFSIVSYIMGSKGFGKYR